MMLILDVLTTLLPEDSGLADLTDHVNMIRFVRDVVAAEYL